MIKTRSARKMHFLHSCILMIFFALLIPLQASAQNKDVAGTVVDEQGEPLIGVSVIVKNTTSGTFTDMDGKYSIQVPTNAILEFKFMGLETKEEPVNGRTQINVTLLENKDLVLDDVVVVGYGVQKKATLSGAVAGVKGDQMLKTNNENPQNMLTGKIAGVRVRQKSSEPGTYKSDFDIRGMGSPLVVIDGVPREMSDFQRLNPNDIEDLSVLKDASAAIYGARSANGVVLVTTKKGKKNDKTSISYSGSYTIQKPASMPKLADPYETMTLWNEKMMNNVNGGSIIYGQEIFDAYRNGTKRTTDWNKLIFADVAPQTQHDVSITGGSEKIQYYIGTGYLYQEGFFKSGDLNYNKMNLRSNITAEITKGLNLELNLSGLTDERNTPYSDASNIIRSYWRQGVLSPAYADPENTLLNYEGLDLMENTVAKMTSDISGYKKYKQKQFQSSAALNYDFGALSSALKGLSAKVLLSYDYRQDDNTIYRKEYYLYGNYNATSDSYNKVLYSDSSPSQLKREYYSKQQSMGQFLLNYNRTFNKDHSVGAVLGFEGQKFEGDNFYALNDLAFSSDYLTYGVKEGQIGSMYKGSNDLYERTYQAIVGRLNYAFSSRYIVEAQFRYDGSSRFPKDNKWGFFPSASAAWRISEEPFFKSISALSFVNQLKLRASYGVVGNDGSLNYEWATDYIYPATSGNAENGYYNQYAPGYVFDGKFINAMSVGAIANKGITWEESRTVNFGVDVDAWNGLFGFTVDYFERKNTGLFKRRSSDIPTVVGAEAPMENLDSNKNLGIDLELRHSNKIGDFSYNAKAIATITRNKYLNAAEKGPWANSYDRWRNDNLTNRYQGMQFGLASAGRYQSWQDIWTYAIYKGRDVLPGDYKYQDWNGDGEINSQDEHPIAFDQTPWFNYSLSLDAQYKNFDLSVLFQGSALGSLRYEEALYAIWGEQGGGTLQQFLDRWHPVDPTADPYDPATEWISGYYAYTGHSPEKSSEFNQVSSAYLRLKSLELGYTIPKLKSWPTMSLRVFANAYNIFTITKVKFIDPELPADEEGGRMYPLNKTYTLGVSLTF